MKHTYSPSPLGEVGPQAMLAPITFSRPKRAILAPRFPCGYVIDEGGLPSPFHGPIEVGPWPGQAIVARPIPGGGLLISMTPYRARAAVVAHLSVSSHPLISIMRYSPTFGVSKELTIRSCFENYNCTNRPSDIRHWTPRQHPSTS